MKKIQIVEDLPEERLEIQRRWDLLGNFHHVLEGSERNSKKWFFEGFLSQDQKETQISDKYQSFEEKRRSREEKIQKGGRGGGRP